MWRFPKMVRPQTIGFPVIIRYHNHLLRYHNQSYPHIIITKSSMVVTISQPWVTLEDLAVPPWLRKPPYIATPSDQLSSQKLPAKFDVAKITMFKHGNSIKIIGQKEQKSWVRTEGLSLEIK